MKISNKTIIEKQIDWIRNNNLIKKIVEKDVLEITTPFLDNHNDHIQLYVASKEKHLIISDDGYTIADLKMNGFDLNINKNRKIITNILDRFGVKLGISEDLYLETNINELIVNKHHLIQIILSINDLVNIPEY